MTARLKVQIHQSAFSGERVVVFAHEGATHEMLLSLPQIDLADSTIRVDVLDRFDGVAAIRFPHGQLAYGETAVVPETLLIEGAA